MSRMLRHILGCFQWVSRDSVSSMQHARDMGTTFCPPAGKVRPRRKDLVRALTEAWKKLRELQTPNAEKRRRRELAIHEARWQAVVAARERALTWEQSWEAASEALAHTAAAGSAETIRASYKKIVQQRQ
jgi:hypothetical protein